MISKEISLTIVLHCMLNAADATLEHNKNIIENSHVHFHIGENRDKHYR